jgi:hypothetical protein
MLSIAYLKSLRLCWADDALDQAGLTWPDVPTWVWFLGARLHTLPRPAVLQRLAVAHAQAQRLNLVFPENWTRPRKLGAQFKDARAYSDAELWIYLAEFGALLDTADAEADAEKAAALAAATP